MTTFLPTAGRRALRMLALAALLAPLASRADAQTYTVQPGDTLFRIALNHNTTVDELRRLNALDGDVITVGQTLRLSARTPLPQSPAAARPAAAGTPPSPGQAAHTVEAGETLFRIALRYGTTVDELRRLNALDGDAIQVGQRLAVPAGSGAPPIAARPGATATPSPATPSQGASSPAPRAGATTAAPPQAAAAAPAPARTPPARTPAAAPPANRPLSQAPAPRPWAITRTTVPADEAHFVMPGETLYSIAVGYGFTVEEMLEANRLTTAPLEPGAMLVLPRAVAPNATAQRTLPEVEAAGLALVYPEVLAGRNTVMGERYDPAAYTASHRTLPLGSVVLVTNPVNGRSTFVRINDRGPVSQAYLTELSGAAARAIGLGADAAQRVELRLLP